MDSGLAAPSTMSFLTEAQRTMQIIPFELRGEFITLDRLLKATGLAMSGGGAKTKGMVCMLRCASVKTLLCPAGAGQSPWQTACHA